MRQCPHHGIPKHEITQIFYDGLGAPDRYLLDAASGGTFMSKYEDEALELIELVAENSHHHAAKSFGGRSTPVKGGMLDAKAVETGMLLDKIEKLTVAQNLIMDSLKIRPGSDGLAPVSHSDVSPHSHCSFPYLISYFLLFKTPFKPKFDQVNSAIKVNPALCGSTRYLPNT